MVSEVAIADPLQLELTLQQRRKPAAVFGTDGAQSTVGSRFLHRPTHGVEDAMRRSGIAHHRQGFQITGIGRPAQRQAPAQIHNAFAQGIPTFHSPSLACHATVPFEASRRIEGRLHPQHTPLLVIPLDGVLLHVMLDAHPFHPPLPATTDFPVETRVGPASQKTGVQRIVQLHTWMVSGNQVCSRMGINPKSRFRR